MKQHCLFIGSIFILLVFLLNSCTKNEDCPNASIVILLTGYTPTDIDTLIISKYQDHSNFTTLISTSTISTSQTLFFLAKDTARLTFQNGENNVQGGSEWIVKIVATGQEIRLKEFIYERWTHKVQTTGIGLGFDRSPSNCQSPLRSVNINGTTQRFPGSEAVVEQRK